MELRPDTACLVTARDTHAWQDSAWMNARREAKAALGRADKEEPGA
jgi:hypothetical protein